VDERGEKAIRLKKHSKKKRKEKDKEKEVFLKLFALLFVKNKYSSKKK